MKWCKTAKIRFPEVPRRPSVETACLILKVTEVGKESCKM